MIKIDIEMPESCAECPCSCADYYAEAISCNLLDLLPMTFEDAADGRLEDCPLIDEPKCE